MQKKLILSLLITMFILTTTFTSSQAQFYKWTDNEGIAHYSNKPPCDREFEKVYNYIVCNAVKHGLVDEPTNWRHLYTPS